MRRAHSQALTVLVLLALVFLCPSCGPGPDGPDDKAPDEPGPSPDAVDWGTKVTLESLPDEDGSLNEATRLVIHEEFRVGANSYGEPVSAHMVFDLSGLPFGADITRVAFRTSYGPEAEEELVDHGMVAFHARYDDPDSLPDIDYSQAVRIGDSTTYGSIEWDSRDSDDRFAFLRYPIRNARRGPLMHDRIRIKVSLDFPPPTGSGYVVLPREDTALDVYWRAGESPIPLAGAEIIDMTITRIEGGTARATMSITWEYGEGMVPETVRLASVSCDGRSALSAEQPTLGGTPTRTDIESLIPCAAFHPYTITFEASYPEGVEPGSNTFTFTRRIPGSP